VLLFMHAASAAAPPVTQPFLIGADISWLPEDEAAGATYFDKGMQSDLFQILKDHGFNAIRLRVFVDPKSERGYARNMPEAICDLPHTAAMAKRIKAGGMRFLLDFHYSDNWADPGKQTKPATWENLPFPELVKALHDHTHSVVAALKDQGTPPDMVQIGNEIRFGMLWPDGHVGDAPSDDPRYNHWDNLATLIKAGIAAVREVDPSIRIVLHNDCGRSDRRMIFWTDQLLARGVQFDIIGMSCYRQDQEGDWQRTFNDLATRYPQHQLLVAEYSARKRYVNDLMFNTPDHKGIGTFIWEPTRHKEAIFDQAGQNAGGGEPYNFETTAPTTRPTFTTRPTTRPRMSRTHGGRYDTNWLIDLYTQMAKDYAGR
jgi:arabinogalactan endo-1,4-beta-galactosidase